MAKIYLNADSLNISISSTGKKLAITSPKWLNFYLGPLMCNVTIDDILRYPSAINVKKMNESKGKPIIVITYDFASTKVKIQQRFSVYEKKAINLHSELINLSNNPITLNRITLLGLDTQQERKTIFGKSEEQCVVYQNGGYSGSVVSLAKIPEGISKERGEAEIDQLNKTASQTIWEIYNPIDKRAFLVGYTTFERWNGMINTEFIIGKGVVKWSVEFDGGDTLIDPGRTVLEDVIFMINEDPWKLLEDYANIVQRKHKISVLSEPPVSWCSWYPYRLGVSEERILANALIAAKRLKPIGLKIMQVDLGWEKDYLPCFFEENDQFPHGLKWLAERLAKFGFNLGVWIAPYSISEFHPLFKEHPDWLIKDAEGKPLSSGIWFWQPHGNIYCLDLTNLKAQKWLQKNVKSLAQRGVKYLKTDFIGIVSDKKMRHRFNPRIVAGGGLEAARLGAKIINEAITSIDKNALILNCNPVEMSGIGYYPLQYTCQDTGNTGYVGWNHLRDDYATVACHLFKNKRWAIIQPSCLCVGLPGTIEEARVRATATFLSGGQVDISDDLTSLPEDRWKILLATLPPLGISAKPIDLFESINKESLSYNGLSTGDQTKATSVDKCKGAYVWHLSLENNWDKWDLIAFFNYAFAQKGEISRFKVGLDRFNLNPNRDYWIYEFWSGQFLGKIPTVSESPPGYVHPGDAQRLISSTKRGVLEVSFFGPAVKLLVLREVRPYPWVVGTSFHQSSGIELKNVQWNEVDEELSGELYRPAGEQGSITVVGFDWENTRVIIGDKPVNAQPGAFKSLVIPVITESDITSWKVMKIKK